ncbi:MAG: biopolymer transporter ExbD [Chlorobium sp.]|jgi:biopolymer transport protein TolR|nr:biopolymer transporter ExbD [Chlorobium sp.]
MITSGKGRLMSDINVTPFVDVMLVLLIIFMVTAPMMTHGVKVDTPKTTLKKMDAQEHAVVISIDASSRVSVNNDQLNVSEVRSKLPTLLDVARTQEVYLKADKSLPYGVVMDVIAQIKDAGIEKIGMVTEPASAEQQVRR